jgi:hypothetical protein
MKNLPWFSTKGQAAQLLVALVACVLGAKVAWTQVQDNQLLSLGTILFVVLVVIVVLSIGLLLSPPAGAEVKIVNPLSKIRTTTDGDGTRRFEIEGTLKQLPPDTEIWAFIKDVTQPRWWPHGPALVNGTSWTISRINPGRSKEVKLQVCLVGKSGQALIAYYRSLGAFMTRLKADVIKQSASPLNTDEFKAPAITDLGNDMTLVFDKLFPVE